MFLEFQERRFAKRHVKRLLRSNKRIAAKKPDLWERAPNREVLLDASEVDASIAERILVQEEDSIDLWTTHSVENLPFRQVVHFLFNLNTKTRPPRNSCRI
jgi:hypothetical protein